MRFVCDSCRAQYSISDDKVGAKGVKVRCKKCGHNIVVRSAGSASAKDEGTAGEVASGSATSQGQSNEGFGLPATLGTPPEGGIFGGVEDDEIGAVFDQVLNSGSHKVPPGEAGDGPAQLDASAVSDASDAVRKLAEAEAGSTKPAASHEWFVAIDEKQVGPLTMEKVKEHWDKAEVGPDSLCWRAGFSDWIPLSEATELASVLAPRPTRPVIVEPTPVASSSSASSGPVESAFSAGGSSKPGRAETPAPVAPSAQDSGWKPSAASVLASLVKEENEALSKPAPKSSAAEEKAKPASSGLLDVPPPETGAAKSPLLAETPAPAPYMQPAPAPGYAPPQGYPQQPMPQQYAPPQGYAPPPAYPGYPPPAAPKQGGKMGMVIGIAAGALLMVGGVGFFLASRPSDPPPAPQPVAQAPAPAPVKPAEVPATPPPTAVATAPTPAPAPTGTPTPAATAPATAPSAAPAVVAAATPPPATPPPASEPVKPAEEPKAQPQQVARAEIPERNGSKRGSSSSRTSPSRGSSNEDAEEISARSKPVAKSGGGGNADDEFDELFGTKKASAKSGGSANGRTAYIPPEPGGGGATVDRLGQSDIMQVVLNNKPAIVKCVGEQKKKDPGLSGKLVMRWTIQTNGKTKNVSCQTGEFRSTYMATCISGLIKGWNFPKHKVEGDPIDFPFTF